MKTPDEIKKGQKTRCNAKNVCYECEFSNGFMCYAVTRIQPLKSAYGQVGKALCGKENATAEEIIAAFDQVKRERDALLKDLKATDPCNNCKNSCTARGCDGECCRCDHWEMCPCLGCDTDRHWEWAGIKEDNQ